MLKSVHYLSYKKRETTNEYSILSKRMCTFLMTETKGSTDSCWMRERRWKTRENLHQSLVTYALQRESGWRRMPCSFRSASWSNTSEYIWPDAFSAFSDESRTTDRASRVVCSSVPNISSRDSSCTIINLIYTIRGPNLGPRNFK